MSEPTDQQIEETMPPLVEAIRLCAKGTLCLGDGPDAERARDLYAAALLLLTAASLMRDAVGLGPVKFPAAIPLHAKRSTVESGIMRAIGCVAYAGKRDLDSAIPMPFHET